MSNPQQTTKIEQVTEAIEALVLAQTVAITSGGGSHFHEQILIARTELADALKALLTPTLRVVTTEKTDTVGHISTKLSRTVAEAVPYGGKGIDGMNLA
jgi:hypothetical protein